MANEKQQPRNDSEQNRLKKEEQARKARRTSRQLLGLALSVLIVVGAISIIKGGVDLVKSSLDTTSEKESYQKMLAPFVWFDIVPFESTSQADQNSIKQIAIWGVMEQLGSDVNRSEMGQPLIPVVEVDRFAASIFGPNFKFTEHGAFSNAEFDLSYEFDEAKQVYIMPTTGLQVPYLPTVMEIQRERGGIKRVIMGYVNTRGSNNELVNAPDFDHPVKYMDYIFQRDGGQYYLTAVRVNTTYVAPNGSSQTNSNKAQSSSIESSSSVPVSAPAQTQEETTEETPAST